MRFLEAVTSGAQAVSRLPLVVALHPQGGDPADFLPLFAGLTAKARIVLPFADEKNGVGSWYKGNSTAPGPRHAAKRLKPFLAQVMATRPTAGKPIVVGYSQGAIVALTMAVTESATLGIVVSIPGRALVTKRLRAAGFAVHGGDAGRALLARRESRQALSARGGRSECSPLTSRGPRPGP